MKYPYLELPFDDDLDSFLDHVELQFVSGALPAVAYHVALGKALGYVEARFSAGYMAEVDAYEYIHSIEDMIL